MPTSNENRVRVEFLSKMTATPRGPSRGRRLNGSFFSSAASSRTSACSAGDSVVVAQEVPRHRAPRSRRCPGCRAGRVTKLSIWASVMTSGGASRMTSGAGGVDQESGLAGGRLGVLGARRGQHHAPAAIRGRACGRSAGDRAIRRRGATTCPAPRPAAPDRRRPAPAAPPGPRRCRSGYRRRCCRAGRESTIRAAGPTASTAPIGRPPPSPLARVTTSGVMPSCWWAKKAPVRPIPVCTSSSTSSAPCCGGDLAGGGQVAGGRDDDAALPHDRFQEYRRGLVVDGAGQRVGIAVGHVRDVARQRRERRLLGRLTGQRQRAHRPAVETLLCGNQFRAAGEPGQLERQFVGLGAGVAEEHPRLLRRRPAARRVPRPARDSGSVA